MARQADVDGLVLVVLVTSFGTAVHALTTVEKVGGTVPDIAESVDVQRLLEVTLADSQTAFARGRTYIYITHASFVHEFLELGFVLGADLNDHPGILGEENLLNVVGFKVDEVDLHAAMGVGKAHLQQAGDETAGADVVTCQQQFLAHTFLHGIEGIAEVFGVGAGRNIGAYLAMNLCKGATAQAQLIKGEVDVVEGRLGLVGQHGTDDLADVADLTAGRHNDGARSDNLAAIGVFLGHGEAVLARGNVDFQSATEVRERFDGVVETGIFTLLRTAGPHPVGAETDAVETFAERRPDEVGQALGDRENRTGSGIGKTRLGGMAERCGYASATTVVKGDHAAVREGQLNLTLTLLASDLARDAAVHLVRQPVLTSHGFEGEDFL